MGKKDTKEMTMNIFRKSKVIMQQIKNEGIFKVPETDKDERIVIFGIARIYQESVRQLKEEQGLI